MSTASLRGEKSAAELKAEQLKARLAKMGVTTTYFNDLSSMKISHRAPSPPPRNRVSEAIARVRAVQNARDHPPIDLTESINSENAKSPEVGTGKSLQVAIDSPPNAASPTRAPLSPRSMGNEADPLPQKNTTTIVSALKPSSHPPARTGLFASSAKMSGPFQTPSRGKDGEQPHELRFFDSNSTDDTIPAPKGTIDDTLDGVEATLSEELNINMVDVSQIDTSHSHSSDDESIPMVRIGEFDISRYYDSMHTTKSTQIEETKHTMYVSSSSDNSLDHNPHASTPVTHNKGPKVVSDSPKDQPSPSDQPLDDIDAFYTNDSFDASDGAHGDYEKAPDEGSKNNSGANPSDFASLGEQDAKSASPESTVPGRPPRPKARRPVIKKASTAEWDPIEVARSKEEEDLSCSTEEESVQEFDPISSVRSPVAAEDEDETASSDGSAKSEEDQESEVSTASSKGSDGDHSIKYATMEFDPIENVRSYIIPLNEDISNQQQLSGSVGSKAELTYVTGMDMTASERTHSDLSSVNPFSRSNASKDDATEDGHESGRTQSDLSSINPFSRSQASKDDDSSAPNEGEVSNLDSFGDEISAAETVEEGDVEVLVKENENDVVFLGEDSVPIEKVFSDMESVNEDDNIEGFISRMEFYSKLAQPGGAPIDAFVVLNQMLLKDTKRGTDGAEEQGEHMVGTKLAGNAQRGTRDAEVQIRAPQAPAEQPIRVIKREPVRVNKRPAEVPKLDFSDVYKDLVKGVQHFLAPADREVKVVDDQDSVSVESVPEPEPEPVKTADEQFADVYKDLVKGVQFFLAPAENKYIAGQGNGANKIQTPAGECEGLKKDRATKSLPGPAGTVDKERRVTESHSAAQAKEYSIGSVKGLVEFEEPPSCGDQASITEPHQEMKIDNREAWIPHSSVPESSVAPACPKVVEEVHILGEAVSKEEAHVENEPSTHLTEQPEDGHEVLLTSAEKMVARSARTETEANSAEDVPVKATVFLFPSQDEKDGEDQAQGRYTQNQVVEGVESDEEAEAVEEVHRAYVDESEAVLVISQQVTANEVLAFDYAEGKVEALAIEQDEEVEETAIPECQVAPECPPVVEEVHILGEAVSKEARVENEPSAHLTEQPEEGGHEVLLTPAEQKVAHIARAATDANSVEDVSKEARVENEPSAHLTEQPEEGGHEVLLTPAEQMVAHSARVATDANSVEDVPVKATVFLFPFQDENDDKSHDDGEDQAQDRYTQNQVVESDESNEETEPVEEDQTQDRYTQNQVVEYDETRYTQNQVVEYDETNEEAEPVEDQTQDRYTQNQVVESDVSDEEAEPVDEAHRVYVNESEAVLVISQQDKANKVLPFDHAKGKVEALTIEQNEEVEEAVIPECPVAAEDPPAVEEVHIHRGQPILHNHLAEEAVQAFNIPEEQVVEPCGPPVETELECADGTSPTKATATFFLFPSQDENDEESAANEFETTSVKKEEEASKESDEESNNEEEEVYSTYSHEPEAVLEIQQHDEETEEIISVEYSKEADPLDHGDGEAQVPTLKQDEDTGKASPAEQHEKTETVVLVVDEVQDGLPIERDDDAEHALAFELHEVNEVAPPVNSCETEEVLPIKAAEEVPDEVEDATPLENPHLLTVETKKEEEEDDDEEDVDDFLVSHFLSPSARDQSEDALTKEQHDEVEEVASMESTKADDVKVDVDTVEPQMDEMEEVAAPLEKHFLALERTNEDGEIEEVVAFQEDHHNLTLERTNDDGEMEEVVAHQENNHLLALERTNDDGDDEALLISHWREARTDIDEIERSRGGDSVANDMDLSSDGNGSTTESGGSTVMNDEDGASLIASFRAGRCGGPENFVFSPPTLPFPNKPLPDSHLGLARADKGLLPPRGADNDSAPLYVDMKDILPSASRESAGSAAVDDEDGALLIAFLRAGRGAGGPENINNDEAGSTSPVAQDGADAILAARSF